VFIPIPPQPGQQVSTLDNFLTTEALSGSAFGDTLLGDDLTQVDLQANLGVLSGADRINLVTGLQGILGAGVTSFDGGNIILGGGGSDRITGRGGNDIIDGDAWLNVQLQVGGPNGPRYNSMTELQAAAFAGTLDPGDISIVREILYATGQSDVDTAVFSGPIGNYTISFGTIGGGFDGSVIVTDRVGLDGTDTLRHIERLQFADQLIVLDARGNALPNGLLTINDTSPTQGQVLTVSAPGVTDANNISVGNPSGAVNPTIYFWQVADPLNPTVFTDVALNGTGPTFTVTAAEAGQLLRVRAQYTDGNGVTEQVFSAPTGIVVNINDAPVGLPTISDTTPTEGQVLSVANTFTDADGITLTGPNATLFSYQWQSSLNGTTWTAIAGATTSTFSPAQAQVGQFLRVVVSYADNLLNPETVTSAATSAVGDAITGTAANNTLNGTAGDDTILGLAGNDTMNGNGGNDLLDAGLGNDIINGGAGNDLFLFRPGDGGDTRDGGTGNDVLSIVGGVGNENQGFVWNGTSLSIVASAGGSINNIEVITLDYGVGTDTLNFATSTAAVNVDLNGTASGFTWIANVENATGGSGADTLTGNTFNNVLDGGSGNDILSGDAGNDTLNGGLGNDTMTGGAGNDIMSTGAGQNTFVFAAGFGADTINGFDANPSGTGQDSLNIHALGITAATFASRVAIAVAGGNTVVTIDGNDSITLNGVTGIGANVITQADFIL
jgi:Ca2+-binding RTX toxin-like protein